jgi:hypothetical protein
MGDGGCNIASAMGKRLPGSFVIAYNTSNAGLNKISADVLIHPEGEDGSGKDRTFSRDMFKSGVYKNLISAIQNAAEKMTNLEYILVTTTCSGGTGGGSSSVAAKLIADNVNVPVIIVGVYPSQTDDMTAQYNTLQWQSEVIKYELPYIILDNNTKDSSVFDTHEQVNEQAAEIAEILSGRLFGETNISAIDNRDMYMLLHHIGGRICVYGSVLTPNVGQSIDELLLEVSAKWNEPAPINTKGFGLFVKGPEDMIRSIDTSLTKLRQEFGNASVQYVHLEVSDEKYIALVCTGCDEPMARLTTMRKLYDQMSEALKSSTSLIDSLNDGLANPLGASKRHREGIMKELDISALDL